MKKHEFSLDEIVKGLQCGSCSTCPYCHVESCTHYVKQDAIAMLKSQQAEIERLKDEVGGLRQWKQMG